MIAFKYTKQDGAEYLSHLDLLRHIYRTLRRAGIAVEKSCGFHAHPRIFLNNPLPVGVCSVAEYGAVDAHFTGDFKAAFNSFSPSGVKCLAFTNVMQNPNYANDIEKCLYRAEGITRFDVCEVLDMQQIVICDLRGREVDIRPRIDDMHFDEDGLYFTLYCGNKNLRPDLFASYLCERFGGRAESITKLAAYGKATF